MKSESGLKFLISSKHNHYLRPNQCVLVPNPHWTRQICDVQGDRFVRLFVLFCHLKS